MCATRNKQQTEIDFQTTNSTQRGTLTRRQTFRLIVIAEQQRRVVLRKSVSSSSGSLLGHRCRCRRRRVRRRVRRRCRYCHCCQCQSRSGRTSTTVTNIIISLVRSLIYRSVRSSTFHFVSFRSVPSYPVCAPAGPTKIAQQCATRAPRGAISISARAVAHLSSRNCLLSAKQQSLEASELERPFATQLVIIVGVISGPARAAEREPSATPRAEYKFCAQHPDCSCVAASGR